MSDHQLTIHDLDAARKEYEKISPRDVMYRAGTLLVDLALQGRIDLTVAEAIGVLLLTWNKELYKYRKFDEQHFCDIERLLDQHKKQLAAYRPRTIEQLDDRDEDDVVSMLQEFETVLGPVGASKTLHLLAPQFFPIWDRDVSKHYGLGLSNSGTNGKRYWEFMLIAQKQCCDLRVRGETGNLLKAIDECNWVRARQSVSLRVRPAATKKRPAPH